MAETKITKSVSKTSLETINLESEENRAENMSATQEQTEPMVYAGATVPGFRTNTIFTGPMPEVINVPMVRNLCVPLSEFPKVMMERKQPGTRAYICHNESMKLAEKLKNKN